MLNQRRLSPFLILPILPLAILPILLAMMWGALVLEAAEKNADFDLQSQAYFSAQDYSQAMSMYNQRLESSVQPWEKNRLLYNLGTIELAQNKSAEALFYFQQIKPENLALPYLASHLYINISTAYLKIAAALSSESDKQHFFIEMALIALKRAEEFDCAGEKVHSCAPNPRIEEKHKLAQALLEQNQKIRFDDGMQKLSVQKDKDASPLEPIKYDYEVLLLQLNPSLADVKKLIGEIDRLKIEEGAQQKISQIKVLLEESLSNLKSHQNIEARFFLIASFDEFEMLSHLHETSPITIMQRALDHSIRTLQLIYLFQLIYERQGNDEALPILIFQQKRIGNLVAPFISTVLEQETASYHQKEHPDQQCQESPWDQAIPLFDHGLNNTQEVEKELSKTPIQAASLIAYQEAVVSAWKETLNLLMNPPQKKLNEANQNLNESFRLIQEMYMEDQAKSVPEPNERYSW